MKFSKYIGLATLCMCLNGCTDFIDNAPDDIITIDMIFDDGRLASRCIPRHSGSILGLYALRCVRDAGKRYHSIARLVTILG